MMTTIYSGLSDGALYALVGIVLTIPLVRCGDFNFAQPAYVVLGEYVVVQLQSHRWSVIPILILLLTLGAVLGGVQEFALQRPTRGRDTALLTMLGMFIAIQGFIIAYYGTNPESAAFFGGGNPVWILGGVLDPVDLWLIGLMFVSAGLFQYAVRRTRWGVLGRASMTDETSAKLRGVNVPRLRTVAFILAGALSTALGLFVGPMTGVDVDTSLTLILFAFAAMAIGGFGSFSGTAIGGIIIGLISAFSSRYLNVDWASILVFALLCMVLVIRPRGLFGARHLRLV
jgi:branched-chain amino acid transport system permease protein